MITCRNPQSPLGVAPAILYGPDRNTTASTPTRPSRREPSEHRPRARLGV